MKYSSFRLAVLNLFIGMCRGSPGLPRTIRQMGYRDRWIPGTVLGGRGAAAEPVLVLASAESKHSVFIQVVSKKRVTPSDLNHYLSMSAVHLREQTALTKDQTELYGVAVFGLARHRESLRSSLSESRIRPTLILQTPEGLVIDANPFPKVGLANVFRPVLALDWGSVPLGWIPFDHESSPAEIAADVVPRVVARAADGERRVEIADICAEHPLWSISTAFSRERMRSGVAGVLATAAEREFRGFFTVRDGALDISDLGRAAVRFPGSPTLKRMMRRHGDLLDRLRGDGGGQVPAP